MVIIITVVMVIIVIIVIVFVVAVVMVIITLPGKAGMERNRDGNKKNVERSARSASRVKTHTAARVLCH